MPTFSNIIFIALNFSNCFHFLIKNIGKAYLIEADCFQTLGNFRKNYFLFYKASCKIGLFVLTKRNSKYILKTLTSNYIEVIKCLKVYKKGKICSN